VRARIAESLAHARTTRESARTSMRALHPFTARRRPRPRRYAPSYMACDATVAPTPSVTAARARFVNAAAAALMVVVDRTRA